MATPSTQSKALAVAKLGSSGLLPQHISASVVEAADMASLGFQPYPALRIRYLHPLTQEPLRPRPHWPEFTRYRYLVDVPTTGKKPIRYTQPPNTGVCAFFPHIIDWQQVFEGNGTIIITEGELKAAKACERGFPTIGLGGVWNFMGNAACTGFLPELELIPWPRRKVLIIYDSDARTKPDVIKALNALAHELELRGALPFTVMLPELTGEQKCGLDDYFIANPDPAAFKDFIRSNEQSLTLAQPLWEMNEQMAFVHDPGLVVNVKTGQFMNTQSFLTSTGNRLVTERKLNDDGTISMKSKPLPPAWMKWPLRREHGKITYLPGQQTTPEEFNTWAGWKSAPVKGDVSKFLALIDHIFSTATKDDKTWFLRWLAYPIQNPGAKLYTAAVLHGAKKGTGKSFIGYCMREIYGTNWTEIKQDDLESTFNEWSVNKQFILGDDVTGNEARSFADKLKHLITRKENRINRKFLPTYVVPDCVNYLFTSQQPDAFFLEDGDRRFFVHEVTCDPLSPAFYHDLEDWIIKGDHGRNHLHYYLLHLPLGDFDPRDKAPMTAAKAAMTSIGRSDLAQWVAELQENPDSVLRFGAQPLASDAYSSRDLLALYDPSGKTRTTSNAMARALKRAGFEMANKGEAISYGDQRERLFLVRNRERWANTKNAELLKHLAKTKKGPSPR